MNWLASMQDQMPLLLVLSPMIGFVVTSIALQKQRDLVRYFAISNSLCTTLILFAVLSQFASESREGAAVERLLAESTSEANPSEHSPEAIRHLLERQRVERIGRLWFCVDGTNLWPAFVIVVLSGVIVWRCDRPIGHSSCFISHVLLFESTSLATMTAYDLRVFMVAFGVSSLVMSLIIGHWGGLDRRTLAGRFLFAQLCGSSFIMLGFAMLVAAVPWMKIEASSTLPEYSYNIGKIVFEVQRWTTGHEASFQYGKEVLPWTMFVLSLGFAIAFGLFPFHSWQTSLLSRCPRTVVVMYLAGSLSACVVGWLRFVLPLAPDLLVRFDWLILIPTLGGAIWGSIRTLAPDQPRDRAAYAFLSLSGISLFGCYCMTNTSISGGWLMQQQLIATFCAAMLTLNSTNLENEWLPLVARPNQGRLSTRAVIFRLCLPALGFFASGSMILAELLRENLLLVATALGVMLLHGLTILWLLNCRDQNGFVRQSTGGPARPEPSKTLYAGTLIAAGLLAGVVNLAPGLMLRQCEPTFDRVFHRFERAPSTPRP